jgi:hypothetical protein
MPFVERRRATALSVADVSGDGHQRSGSSNRSQRTPLHSIVQLCLVYRCLPGILECVLTHGVVLTIRSSRMSAQVVDEPSWEP